MRRTILTGFALAAVALGCVGTDYTRGVTPPPLDAGDLFDAAGLMPDAAPDVPPKPDAGGDAGDAGAGIADGLYVVQCITALAAGDPAQALRFKALLEGEKVTLTPLHGWNLDKKSYEAPATIGQTAGNPVTEALFGVETGSFFVVLAKTVTLVAEANSISGRDAVIQQMKLTTHKHASGDLCSSLEGKLVTPYSYDFNGADKANRCHWRALARGDTAVPKLTEADFVCP